jgi:hypothetical protein
MPRASPHDLVTSRRWEHALFTTYALSLSFFEAHLLRTGLKKNGCGDIWVVVDADGYSDSLAEKQATSVGQDYHLVPVALPRGVFHPKCTYLASPDGDILIVGSGNLTFGGYGRNVEVFEAFTSTEHPAIFAQFAQFLEMLQARSDFINPEPAWIDTFARLARRVGGPNVPASDPAKPRLVHCTQTPVNEALRATIADHGGANSLRVLSPFFDPDGSAVTRIADESSVGMVTIGLLPDQTNSSAFPFSRHTVGKRLRAAIIEDSTEPLDRRLHAKWIEADLLDGRVLTLSGSVNATSQSLCTTNNIEVAVLRVEPPTTARRLKWRSIPLPTTYETHSFRTAGLGARCVLHARLTVGASIEGRLLSSGDPSGTWEARLARKDGVSTTFAVAVGTNGDFSHRLTGPADFEHASGLQLYLTRQLPSPLTACGWVQNEAILALSQISQVPVHSLLNQIRGEATDEDDILVLELLATGLQNLWHKPAGGEHRVDDHAPKPPEVPVSAPVSALAPGESIRLSSMMLRGPSAVQHFVGLLDRVVNRVFADLTDTGVHLRALPHAEEGDEDIDDEEVEERPAIPPKAIALLERIRDKVRELPDGEHRRILLNLWLGVSLQLHLRSNLRAEAAAFCREWFFTATQCYCHEPPTGLLTQNVFHAAAALAANLLGSDDAPKEFVRLHDALENFCGFLAPRESTSQLSPLPNLLRRIVQDGGADTAAGLTAVLAARTRRQEIELVLKAVKERRPPPSGDLAIFTSSTGRQLLRDLQSRTPPRLLEFTFGRNSCPHLSCYLRLPDESLRELRRLRLCRCVNCDTYLYHLASSE